jgi:chitinase
MRHPVLLRAGKHSTLGLAASLVVLLFAAPASSALAARGSNEPQHGHQRFERVAYFIQWGIYARSFFVKNVATSGAAAHLSTINYAFGGIKTPDLTCTSVDPWADFQRPASASESVDGVADTPTQPLAGNFNQLRKLKAQNPNLRVLMSLGGFSLSTPFSDAALTAAAREKLVASCIDLFIKGNLGGAPGAGAGVFDGFDIDWEWPGAPTGANPNFRPEDKTNFTLLLREFRTQLDALSAGTRQRYLLTAFLPANPNNVTAGFEVSHIFRFLDWATVQGYDLHGTWESTTNYQSALFAPSGDPSPVKFDVNLAIQTLLAKGAPSSKLVMGLPFYSRGWTGVTNMNNGLFQTASGPAPATFEAGVDDYKKIVALPGFRLFRDNAARAAYLFDGTTFWTLDDPTVIGQKMRYVRQRDLGGAMAWELSGDDAQASLVKAMDSGLQRGD